MAVNINKWSEIPAIYKETTTLKKVAFQNNPFDKGLIDLLKNAVINDKLSPAMSGISFGEKTIAATNAHILISLPYANRDFYGVYCTPPRCIKNISPKDNKVLLKEDFPKYFWLIPTDVNRIFPITVAKLKKYITALVKGEYVNKTINLVVVKVAGDEKAAYNVRFMLEILDFWQKIGKETIYFGYTSASKQLLILDNKEAFSLPNGAEVAYNNIVTILMPLFSGDALLGAYDIDKQTENNVYYSFQDDEIINADGTIANHLDAKDNDKEDTYTQEINNVVSVVMRNKPQSFVHSFVLIDKGFLYAKNSETVIKFAISGYKDGLYAPINGALRYDDTLDEDNNSPVLPIENGIISARVNRLELLFNLRKMKNFVSKDELRPALTGIYFELDSKGNSIRLTATDAHVLYTTALNSARIFEAQDFILGSIDTFIAFLEYSEDEEVDIAKIGANYVKMEVKGLIIVQRIIDARYPDYTQVIPREVSKKCTIDLSALKKCLKNMPKGNDFSLDFLPNGKKYDIEIKEAKIKYGKKMEFISHGKLCDLDVLVEEGKYTIPENLVLIMPVMPSDENSLFSFRYKGILDKIISISDNAELVLIGSDNIRGFIIDSPEFSIPPNSIKNTGAKPKNIATKKGSVLSTIIQQLKIAR